MARQKRKLLKATDFWGKALGSYRTIGDCIRETGLTYEEVCEAVQEKKCVKGYCLQIHDETMMDIAIADCLENHGCFSTYEIAEVIGVSQPTVAATVSKFKKRLRGAVFKNKTA